MKKHILSVIQVLVTVGILFWIFHDPHKRAQMIEALQNADQRWIVAGILLYGIIEILAAFRWHLLLRVQQIRLSFSRVCALLMIGIFFNQFMPGGTGGDVVKIFYLLKETPGKKAQAVLAALIDRLVGLFGLIVIASLIVYFRYDWLTKFEITRNLTWSLMVVLAASLGGIAFSFAITGLGLVEKLPQRMPFRDKLVELSIAYNLYARAWKTSLLSIFISLGIHIASFLVFYAAARSLRATIPFGDFIAVMPIISTLASLPISVGGTGVREGLFQALLSALCGIREADAVVISLTGFVMILFWGLLGGVIYLFYRPTEHAKISEMTHEVEAVEEKIVHPK